MITVVGSEKGGVGKTTLATNIATVIAAEPSVGSVLLVSCDKQGSAVGWATIRYSCGVEPNIEWLSKLGADVGSALISLRDDFDHIVVDCAGEDSTELRQAMMVADRMLLPLLPSSFDIWTLGTLAEHVKSARAKGNAKLTPLMVINKASTNASLESEVTETRDLLASFDGVLRLANTVVHDRVVFRRAVRSGHGVIEVSGSRKAADEVRALCEELYA
jgi:chromosome partitioning protein